MIKVDVRTHTRKKNFINRSTLLQYWIFAAPNVWTSLDWSSSVSKIRKYTRIGYKVRYLSGRWLFRATYVTNFIGCVRSSVLNFISYTRKPTPTYNVGLHQQTNARFRGLQRMQSRFPDAVRLVFETNRRTFELLKLNFLNLSAQRFRWMVAVSRIASTPIMTCEECSDFFEYCNVGVVGTIVIRADHLDNTVCIVKCV